MTRYLRSFTHCATLSAMLAISALSCAPARAADPDVDTRSVSVGLGDIDLFSPVGRAVAQKRIAIAATRACSRLRFSDPAVAGWFETCRNEAMSAAGSDLDRKLAALRPAGDLATTLASR